MGDYCKGWNVDTGKPYPKCEDGLRCVLSGIPSELGKENQCKILYGHGLYGTEKAGEGENCEGFDETKNKPFPDCESGLVCVETGDFTIPGAGKRCMIPDSGDDGNDHVYGYGGYENEEEDDDDQGHSHTGYASNNHNHEEDDDDDDNDGPEIYEWGYDPYVVLNSNRDNWTKVENE